MSTLYYKGNTVLNSLIYSRLQKLQGKFIPQEYAYVTYKEYDFIVLERIEGITFDKLDQKAAFTMSSKFAQLLCELHIFGLF